MNKLKSKRKTFTSSAVKKRYNDKTYQKYTISLRKIEDAPIINFIEQQRQQEIPITDIFRQAFERAYKEELSIVSNTFDK